MMRDRRERDEKDFLRCVTHRSWAEEPQLVQRNSARLGPLPLDISLAAGKAARNAKQCSSSQRVFSIACFFFCNENEKERHQITTIHKLF